MPHRWLRGRDHPEAVFSLPGSPTIVGDAYMAGVTDRGRVRRTNEDAIHCDPALGLALVADGLGGHAAGEVASATAVTVIRDRLTHERISGILAGDAQAVRCELTACAREANATLTSLSITRRKWAGMGCTLALALLDGNRLHLVNLGDSRAYLIRHRQAQVITQDHSVVAESVTAGHLTPEEADSHPQRHRLTACLGMPTFTPPAYACLSLMAGDRIILCTDGLWDMLPRSTIMELALSSADMRTVAHALLAAANAAGGADNISVVALVTKQTFKKWSHPGNRLFTGR